MVVTAAAVGINAVLTYGLVFGELGMPRLGVAGAGWATTLTVTFMFVALMVPTMVSRHFRPFAIYAGGLRPDAGVIREIFRLGLPVAGISLLESGMFVAVSIFMGTLGPSWLAANQIMFNVIAVGFVIALAVGEACGVRVAHGVGAGTPRAVRTSAVTGVGLGIAVMLTSASLLWLFPERIVSALGDLATKVSLLRGGTSLNDESTMAPKPLVIRPTEEAKEALLEYRDWVDDQKVAIRRAGGRVEVVARLHQNLQRVAALFALSRRLG